MSVLDGEIIVGAIDVSGDDGGEVTSVFFSVGAVHGIDKTFGVGVSLVGGVGWAIVKHGFVDGIGCFIGEDAGGEHGN